MALPGASDIALFYRVKCSQIEILESRGYIIPPRELSYYEEGTSRAGFEKFIKLYPFNSVHRAFSMAYDHTNPDVPPLTVIFVAAPDALKTITEALALNEKERVLEDKSYFFVIDGQPDIKLKLKTRHDNVEFVSFHQLLVNPMRHIYSSQVSILEGDELEELEKDVLAPNNASIPLISHSIDPLPIYLNAGSGTVVKLVQDIVYCPNHQEASVAYRRIV